jgi:hypothetical protein
MKGFTKFEISKNATAFQNTRITEMLQAFAREVREMPISVSVKMKFENETKKGLLPKWLKKKI